MIGRTVLHYKILSPLGSGGMGVVYLAEDERLGRQVALKFLPADWSRERVALERFRVEARAASSLSHPGICAIYDIGSDGDTPFIVMEALKGETLRERITKGPMTVTDILEIGIQLSDALDAAHGQGIVHRDIKPANIFLVEKNRVKVLDFGLAKLTSAPSGLSSLADTTTVSMPTRDNQMTKPGMAIGTVSYMSPEQARGEDVDSRTDLFSLGAVLYEMATGQLAFGGSSAAVAFEAILNRNPQPLSRVNPLLPPSLEAVVAKALEKERELRYQHASDLQAELKRIRRDLDVASHVLSHPHLTAAQPAAPGTASTQVVDPASRRSRYAGAAVGVLVIAAAAGWFWPGRGADPARTAPPIAGAAVSPAAPAPAPQVAAGDSPPAVTGSLPPPAGASQAAASDSRSVLAPRPRPTPPADAGPTRPAAAASTPADAPQPQRQAPVEPVPVQVPPLPVAPAAEPQAGGAVARDTAPAPSPPVPPPAATPAPAPEVPPASAARSTAPPRPPAPATSATEGATQADDEAAIQRVIRTYERAIETKDLALYRSIRPSLTAGEEAQLRNSFRQVEVQEITIRVESLTIDGPKATARIARQDTLITGGRRQTQNSAQTLRFEKTATGWVITN